MMEYNPQIQKRDTEELIAIANSTTKEWQQAAIVQAREELTKRGITKEFEQKVIQRWEEEFHQIESAYQKKLEHNEFEGYTAGKMLSVFLSAPFILGGRIWRSEDLSLSELRHENYQKKFRQRLFLLLGGVVFWVLLFIASLNYIERKRQAEIDTIDLSEWEENYIGLEDSPKSDILP
jgi:hypothetical protein